MQQIIAQQPHLVAELATICPPIAATMSPMELAAAVATAVAALEPHLDRAAAGDGPVLRRPPVAEVADRLELERWIADGGMDVDALSGWLEQYLAVGTRLQHPNSLAHQVAVPDVPAMVADLVHGAINNPMAIYDMGAAATTIELAITAWMTRQAGLPTGAGGVLTHGGSLANLTALLAARAAHAPDAWTAGAPHDLALLCTPSAHYSITRAAGILGIGTDAIVPLPVDELDRIDPARLDEALAQARAAGRRPFALVTAACATSTGLFDDLTAAADFAQAHGLWLHVDGAHGASALLSPEHRHRLAGIERADSIIWDAHKLLRVSGLCAAVLVRDTTALDRAFRQQASYLFYDHEAEDEPGPDLITRAVECTKTELGTKLFLELAARGERGLGADVADRFAVARDAYELLREQPGFSVPYEPETNIVCFRVPGDDAHQVALREALLADGDVHLSSAEIAGRRHLRLVVTAPATTRATLEHTIARVVAASSALCTNAD
jgi:L-2,4-diaminobutyrate decarboxylase